MGEKGSARTFNKPRYDEERNGPSSTGRGVSPLLSRPRPKSSKSLKNSALGNSKRVSALTVTSSNGRCPSDSPSKYTLKRILAKPGWGSWWSEQKNITLLYFKSLTIAWPDFSWKNHERLKSAKNHPEIFICLGLEAFLWTTAPPSSMPMAYMPRALVVSALPRTPSASIVAPKFEIFLRTPKLPGKFGAPQLVQPNFNQFINPSKNPLVPKTLHQRLHFWGGKALHRAMNQ